MTRVLLSSNGDFISEELMLPDFDYVIAVDGGIRHLYRLGIVPDLWVGDMDSSKQLAIDSDYLKKVKIERLPEKKDMSDADYAVEKALERKATELVMIGGIGSRLDHSLFNLNLFFGLSRKNIACQILDGRQEIRFLCAGEYAADKKELSYDLCNQMGKTASLVPFTDLRSISLEGFEYPLFKRDISRYSNLTLSNVVQSEDALIKVKEGMLLLILSSGY